MKTLHLSILVVLCAIFSSVILLQDANATVPLAIITISGGANDHNCGNTCFLPQNINVTRATAVMWVNKDLVPHDIVSGNPGDQNNGTLFDSGSIWIGKSFIYDFNNVGTFHYFDKTHPTEAGTITITDEPNNANASSTFFYADKNTYVKGDNILIYGSVGSYDYNTPVTIQILDNRNNSLLVSNTYPKPDASFIARISTNNTNWKSGGPYDVKVQYGSVYIGDSTFVYYADQLTPLKQADAGVDYASITCDSGLVTIMKQEDGTVACVKPTSLQKLISLNWGYDPSEKLTVYGLKSVYKAGQEIDFKFRINTMGDPCGEPQITVKDSNQKIVWQSQQFSMSCQAGIQPYENYRAEGSLGNNTNTLGYQMGLLRINQPGTYSLNILWWNENVTKEFVVTPQTFQNATLPDSFEPCNTPYPQSNTGVTILYMPVNSIGKICVRYSNPNDTPEPIGITIFDANNIHNQNVTGITTWNDSGGNNTISKGNGTVVYWIRAVNQTGFYGVSFYCGNWSPLAIGYDNKSNMTADNFPFLNETFPCPLQPYQFHIDSLTGIGVKHIP